MENVTIDPETRLLDFNDGSLTENTRAILRAALDSRLTEITTRRDHTFGDLVPTTSPEVPSSILDPLATWTDSAAYAARARELAELFHKQLEQFSGVPAEISEAGPRTE